jgi:sugar phosphate isomerase/epimerase
MIQPGITHHLLFPASLSDPAVHEATLAEMLTWPEVTTLDLYCAGDVAQRAREIARIRDRGCGVVYNCPLLVNLPGCDPNAVDPPTVQHTRAAALPHLDAAAACGARTITIASGRNPRPEARTRALAGWIDFLAWFGTEAKARGLRAVIEPFDQSIGKNLLIGPTIDAVMCVELVRATRGLDNVGLMVDMGHLPLMGEDFATAIELSAPCLWHVHLGSAVMRHPAHPLYGDNHPPLGLAEGEHDAAHLVAFLHALQAVGYLDAPGATLTFEMRPYPGLSERESAARAFAMLAHAWEHLIEGGCTCA